MEMSNNQKYSRDNKASEVNRVKHCEYCKRGFKNRQWHIAFIKTMVEAESREHPDEIVDKLNRHKYEDQ